LNSKIDNLCEEHVLWFVKRIKPLLASFMKHGYKHGFEDGKKETLENERMKQLERIRRCEGF